MSAVEYPAGDARLTRATYALKPVDPDEVTLAPKMSEVEFWDTLTAPLLAMFADGPMKWSDIDAAVELLGMNPRFEHHAIAYLEQSALIHHVGAVDVTWFYGPAPEEDHALVSV